MTFEDFEGTFAREYYDDALDVADADPVDVATGQDVSGIDAELSAGAHIQGDVTAAAGEGELNFFGVTAYRLEAGGTRDAVGNAFVDDGTSA